MTHFHEKLSAAGGHADGGGQGGQEERHGEEDPAHLAIQDGSHGGVKGRVAQIQRTAGVGPDDHMGQVGAA